MSIDAYSGSGTLTFTKQGGGDLTLGPFTSNTAAGTSFLVTAGRLLVSGSNPLGGAAGVTVQAGALTVQGGATPNPAGALLTLAGTGSAAPVLESCGTLTAAVGGAVGDIQWTGNGGFAAQGGPLVVRLNGGTGVVAWGSANFVPAGSSLVLGSAASDNVVDFQNGIDLSGGTRTIVATPNPSSLAAATMISGALVGSGGLNVAGAPSGSGVLVLTGSNTYSGGTTISAGTLQLGSGGAPPGSGSDGSLATSGITDNSVLVYNLAGSQTAAYSIGGSGSLAKLGSGSVTLGGAGNNFSGGLNVHGGSLVVSGSLNTGATAEVMVGDAANAVGLLAVTGSLTVGKNSNPSLDVGGSFASGVGALHVFPGAAVTTASELHLAGQAGAGYGALSMTGGMVTVGTWMIVSGGGFGILNQSGGTLSVPSSHMDLGCIADNTTGVANFSGSAVVSLGNALWIGQDSNNSNSVVNVSGRAVLAANGVLFGTTVGYNNENGTLNLLGGTLATTSVLVGTGTCGTYTLNFNGGTLKAGAGAAATFMTGLTSAYVQTNGGTIDNGGQSITIGQSLLAPSGSGVGAPSGSSGLSLGGANSSYIDTPIVVVTGGGGTGATAVATVSGGSVSGISITNPGVGYTSAPAFTLVGGGGLATVGGSAALAANGAPPGSGGLTFVGSGVTTLSGSNTYTGPTTVTAGVLNLTGTLGGGAGGTAITIGAGATFAEAATGAILGSSSLVYNSSALTTLLGTNTYSGGTQINAGVLEFAASAPVAAGSITVNPGGAIAAMGPAPYNTVSGWLASGLIANSSSGAIALTTSNTDASIDFTAHGGYNMLVLAAMGAVTYNGAIKPGSNGFLLAGSTSGGLALGTTLSGSAALTATGPGTTILTNTNNSYSGGTYLSGGVLSFAASALPGSITFGGGALQWYGANTSDVSARIAPIAAATAAVLDTNGNNVVFAAPLGGSGGLTKAGAGRWCWRTPIVMPASPP